MFGCDLDAGGSDIDCTFSAADGCLSGHCRWPNGVVGPGGGFARAQFKSALLVQQI